MTRTVPAFRSVREENVVLVGSRGASPVEKDKLRKSDATIVDERSVRELGSRGALGPALEAMGGRVRKVHVHLDLDVLDPKVVGPANEFAPEDGISSEEARACVWAVRERLEITSATIASYDPSLDRDGRMLKVGTTLAFATIGLQT